eukprot:133278_1
MSVIPHTICIAFVHDPTYLAYLLRLHLVHISLICWFFGRWSMSAVFVAQLKYSFKNTIHSVSISMLHLLDTVFSLVLLYLFQRKLTQLIHAYFISFNEYKKKQQREMQTQQQIDINDVELDLNVEMTHSIVSLSTSNLHPNPSNNANVHKSTLLWGDSVMGGVKEVDCVRAQKNKYEKQMAKYDKQFDEQKSELIRIMTQYTVLITLIFVPSSLCMIVMSALNSPSMRFVIWFFICTNSALNALCLYLNFPFSSGMYRCLCGCSHKWLAYFCGLWVDRTIVNQQRHEQTETM